MAPRSAFSASKLWGGDRKAGSVWEVPDALFSSVTKEGISGSGVAMEAKLLSTDRGVKTDSINSPEDIGDK